MTHEEKTVVLQKWISDSCDKMFKTFYECALQAPLFEGEGDNTRQYGEKAVAAFVLLVILMVFVEENDRNSNRFEEKAIDVKRELADNLTLIVEYF